jgi:hypothetical protein
MWMEESEKSVTQSVILSKHWWTTESGSLFLGEEDFFWTSVSSRWLPHKQILTALRAKSALLTAGHGLTVAAVEYRPLPLADSQFVTVFSRHLSSKVWINGFIQHDVNSIWTTKSTCSNSATAAVDGVNRHFIRFSRELLNYTQFDKPNSLNRSSRTFNIDSPKKNCD